MKKLTKRNKRYLYKRDIGIYENKYRQYSEKFINTRLNPEYPYVSQHYSSIKKQSQFTHELKK